MRLEIVATVHVSPGDRTPEQLAYEFIEQPGPWERVDVVGNEVTVVLDIWACSVKDALGAFLPRIIDAAANVGELTTYYEAERMVASVEVRVKDWT